MRELLDLVADLRSASRTHLAVRGVAMLGALLFTLSLVLAGPGNPVLWAGLVTAGALVVLNPHTLMPVVFLLLAVGAWWANVDALWHWTLLPAAVGLLLVHAGAALAASVPAQSPVPHSVLRRWAARVGVVSAVTVGVWALAGALDVARSGEGGALPGIVGLAVLAASLVGYARWRSRTG